MRGEELIHGQNHTHLPLLIAAVMQSVGPVLELGTGDASTPNLHALLDTTVRHLTSLDDDPHWVERFASLRTSRHTIARCRWDQLPLIAERYGVVFIDNAPPGVRAGHAELLKHRADFIVLHDTEAEGYGWDRLWPQFRFRTDDRRYRPWTTCVSNVRELQW